MDALLAEILSYKRLKKEQPYSSGTDRWSQYRDKIDWCRARHGNSSDNSEEERIHREFQETTYIDYDDKITQAFRRLREAVAAGGDINTKYCGWTALSLAVRLDDYDTFDFLGEQGASLKGKIKGLPIMEYARRHNERAYLCLEDYYIESVTEKGEANE